MTDTLLVLAGAALVFYAAIVIALALSGRREHSRALAGFVPDCAVLFARLLRDPGLPRRRKAAVAAVAAYLASPIDLVPDFIPVAGQADDALIVAIALRWLVRSGGEDVVARHWPGPEASLRVVLRMAGIRMRSEG
jgi:uncharacterized membrane protein YkvA (DUF1232 family)